MGQQFSDNLSVTHAKTKDQVKDKATENCFTLFWTEKNAMADNVEKEKSTHFIAVIHMFTQRHEVGDISRPFVTSQIAHFLNSLLYQTLSEIINIKDKERKSFPYLEGVHCQARDEARFRIVTQVEFAECVKFNLC